MISLKNSIFILCFLMLLPSCAKIYYSPDANELAMQQKIIAILPPSVSIAAHKKIDAASIIEQQKTESINFQKEMYSWMLKRKMKGNIIAEIQDVDVTNSLLNKANFNEEVLTQEEICKLLNVDGFMSSNFSLSKPMSTGTAIALAVVVGAFGSTNQVTVSISIKDCSMNKLIWNYDHTFSGSIGSTPASCVNGLMRHASKKMPYMVY